MFLGLLCRIHQPLLVVSARKFYNLGVLSGFQPATSFTLYSTLFHFILQFGAKRLPHHPGRSLEVVILN